MHLALTEGEREKHHVMLDVKMGVWGKRQSDANLLKKQTEKSFELTSQPFTQSASWCGGGARNAFCIVTCVSDVRILR